LWYENYDEFKASLDLLLANDKLRKKLGENGKGYIEKNYSRELVEKKYLRILEKLKKYYK